MKTALQELIERLRKEQQTHLDVIDDHRAYHTKDVSNAIKESKVLQFAIDQATELLEKERAEILNAYFEGKMDSVRENRGHMIAELYFKERYMR